MRDNDPNLASQLQVCELDFVQALADRPLSDSVMILQLEILIYRTTSSFLVRFNHRIQNVSQVDLYSPVQRLTRYPLLIRQILQYTDSPETTSENPPKITLQLPGDADERRDISAALEAAEKILKHVNESIREQEGRERLSEISKDLWIGQGCVVSCLLLVLLS